MKGIILVNYAKMQISTTNGVFKIDKVEQRLIPVSRIIWVKSLDKNIGVDVLTREIMKQVKKVSVSDELGGSYLAYYNEDEEPEIVTILETPETIHKQIYSE